MNELKTLYDPVTQAHYFTDMPLYLHCPNWHGKFHRLRHDGKCPSCNTKGVESEGQRKAKK